MALAEDVVDALEVAVPLTLSVAVIVFDWVVDTVTELLGLELELTLPDKLTDSD